MTKGEGGQKMRQCCLWMLPIIPARADVPTIGQFIITPDVISLAIKTFHLRRYYVIIHLKWFTVRVTFTVEQQWGAVISSEGVVLRKTAAAGRTRRMARTLPCSSTTRLRIMTVAFHRTPITLFIMWVRMNLEFDRVCASPLTEVWWTKQCSHHRDRLF